MDEKAVKNLFKKLRKTEPLEERRSTIDEFLKSNQSDIAGMLPNGAALLSQKEFSEEQIGNLSGMVVGGEYDAGEVRARPVYLMAFYRHGDEIKMMALGNGSISSYFFSQYFL